MRSKDCGVLVNMNFDSEGDSLQSYIGIVDILDT